MIGAQIRDITIEKGDVNVKLATAMATCLALLIGTNAFGEPSPRDKVAPGRYYRVCIGSSVQAVRTLSVYDDGWIFVESLHQAAPVLPPGEKYWVNLNQIPCISGYLNFSIP
jgi:hypothetical protein